jgi:hypothetical protein
MADLLIDPAKLETLAKNHEDASNAAKSAADDLSGTGSDCWITHGVISGSSDGAFSTIEGIRQSAGTALKNASTAMAAKLRAAKLAYEGVDSELGGNLNKQMVDR